MNTSNASSALPVDPLYLKYHGAGFSASLALLFLPMFLISSVGIVLNASLVYVTLVRRAMLNGPINALLAVDSIAGILFELSQTLKCFVPLSGINFVPVMTCFWMQVPIAFGSNIQPVVMLFIALERLCCILCPLQMNNMSRFWVKVHLFVITAVGVGYGLYQNVAIYVGILQQLQGKEVLCFNDYQVAWVSNIQYKVNMSLFALTVALYALIWALMIHAAIQKRKVVSGHNMNILRSLNVLMLIIIFGWLLNGALPLYLPLLALSREQSYTFINVLTTISAFASATNAPVLYMFSGEYKRNFQQTFQWLPKTQANSSSNVANGISSRTVAAAAANTVRPAPIHQRFS